MTGSDIIGKLLVYTGLNGKAFSEKVGLLRPQAIYDIQSGKTQNISSSMANKIISVFPEINRGWLQTGEGSMLKTESTEAAENLNVISSGKVIPYYDAEVAAGTAYGMEMTQTPPTGMIEIGGLMKDSEFALRVYGNSMTPNYPAGCVVGLKQHNEHFIEPGTVYVIETTENRYLKRLYYNEDKTALLCISDNHMKHESGPMEGKFFYPAFEIPFEDVQRLLRVTGVIKRNIL